MEEIRNVTDKIESGDEGEEIEDSGLNLNELVDETSSIDVSKDPGNGVFI